MPSTSRMFDACRNDDHDDCAAEMYEENAARLVRCVCECHRPWEPDRAYAAGYAYASGYAD